MTNWYTVEAEGLGYTRDIEAEDEVQALRAAQEIAHSIEGIDLREATRVFVGWKTNPRGPVPPRVRIFAWNHHDGPPDEWWETVPPERRDHPTPKDQLLRRDIARLAPVLVDLERRAAALSEEGFEGGYRAQGYLKGAMHYCTQARKTLQGVATNMIQSPHPHRSTDGYTEAEVRGAREDGGGPAPETEG